MIYAKNAPTTAEIAPMMERPAALVTPPLVPRPPVAVGWGVLVVTVKLERAEFAELMTEERDEREELSPGELVPEELIPEELIPELTPEELIPVDTGTVVHNEDGSGIEAGNDVAG